MTPSLNELLRELESFGETNDASGVDRSRRMLNITRDTGEFLAVLVNSTNAKNILEVGTSNGYSTIWLAIAASKIGGTVRTIEYFDYKVSLARDNFQKSGLAETIDQIHADAGRCLETFARDEFDLIFLDSERSEYVTWWSNIKRIIRTGGLLVVDNALSHATEMQPLISVISQDQQFATSLVPIGNGEFLASKMPTVS
jgi:predicted O-methyltransferase YrrM